MENAQSQGQGSVILMVIAGTLLGFGLGWFVGINNVSPDRADDTTADVVAIDGELADSDILPVGDSPIKGNPNAPVTIVEFTSMQCPHCGRAGETLNQLVERYPEDVRLVFKHFPLRMQQQARPASIAVEAAHRQGKAFEMKDGLFERLSDYRNADMEELGAEIAEQIGLDVDQFRRDFNDDAVAARVDADLELGQSVGVRGTPAFFVNGESMSGAQPLDAFAETVERKLEEVAQMRQEGVADDQIYAASVARHLGDDDGPGERAERERPQREAAEVHMVDVHDDDAIKGASEDDVLVTIMEFSSFQCPFCARGAETMRQLLEKHGDQVRLVFKHFPLGNQQMAEPASRAAIAAGNQDKFWEMYDLIYENQRQLSNAKLEELAQQLGLNMDRWRTDWEASETAALVQRAQREGRSAGIRGTPGFLINGVVVSGAQPLNVFEGHVHDQIAVAEKVKEETGLSGNELYAAIVEHNKENAGGAAEAPTPEEPAEDEPTVIDDDALSVGDSYYKGPSDAPITIYEFSSFQCPFCARGADTLNQVLDRYDGQVRLVYKNFPLPFQEQSEPAARAALAAGEQDKFWEMHEALFSNQSRLSEPGIFEELARDLGLNMDQFNQDMESEAIANQVRAEQREGQSVGVRGTPAFFVNGEMVSGAQPVDAFARIIDRHLADQ